MDESGYCQGCFRTVEEIASWTIYDDQEVSDVIEKCTERKEKTQRTLGDCS